MHIQGLGQFEFVDPGYGFELAASDLGFSADVFGADIGAFDFGIGDLDFSGWTTDYGFGDLGIDSGSVDWGLPADYGVDFDYANWTGADATGNIGLDAAGAGTSWVPDFDMGDVMNLVKGGLTIYQAYNQIQAQRDAASQPPTQQRVTAMPTGTTAARAPAGYTVDPRTGRLVPTAAQQPIGAAAGELVPGVPNWALLAGAGAAAFFIFK